MSDFKFRLATLLRIREAARDERRTDLADCQRAERAVRQQIAECDEEWDRLTSATREAAGPGAVEVDRLVDVCRYRQTLDARRAVLDERLAEVKTDMERHRELLLQADRDMRTLEKLRDAQERRHHQEAHRLDIKRLDESALLRTAAARTA
jgi:flagellar FliJ protein